MLVLSLSDADTASAGFKPGAEKATDTKREPNRNSLPRLAVHTMQKLKPILITAAISIFAVYLFNRFVGPRIGVSA